MKIILISLLIGTLSYANLAGDEGFVDVFNCNQSDLCHIGDIKIGQSSEALISYLKRHKISYQYPYPKPGNMSPDGSAYDVSNILTTDELYISIFDGTIYSIIFDNTAISSRYNNEMTIIDDIIYTKIYPKLYFPYSKKTIENQKPKLFEQLKKVPLIKDLTESFGPMDADISYVDDDLMANFTWKINSYEITLSSPFKQLTVTNMDIFLLAKEKACQQKLIRQTDNIKLRLNENRISFRKTPSLDSKVISYLNKNEQVVKSLNEPNIKFVGEVWPITINDWAAYWFKIRNSNGQEGWVYGWFLEPVE